MSEVPEHLLQRSRERRAALEGTPLPDSPASGDTAPAGGVPAGGAAIVAAPAPTGPSPVFVPEPPPPPRPRPPITRVPTWIVPALAALPIWGFMYLGIFGDRGPEGEAVVSGAEVYATSCASCHGASGQGTGSFPALSDGVAATTFPDEAAHIEWVKTGSQPFTGQTYGAGTRVATGSMPGFEGSLTEEEIQAVVTYEREEL